MGCIVSKEEDIITAVAASGPTAPEPDDEVLVESFLEAEKRKALQRRKLRPHRPLRKITEERPSFHDSP
jgi:hypothetical protein